MTAHASPPTVAVSYLRALFDHLRARQVEPLSLWDNDAPALDPDDRESRLPEAVAAEWFNRAAARLGDPDLGLHVGETIRPGHYGVLGYVAMACATLGEVLQRQQRYQALVLSIAPPEVQAEGRALVLSWNPDRNARYRQLAEFNFAALLTFTRWITGQPLCPLRLDMTYPPPADIREHARVYGCPLRFGEPVYRLVIPAAWTALPLIQPDPAMRELMDGLVARQWQQLAPQLSAPDDPVQRARAEIARRLRDGTPELPTIAAALHCAPRSLQRRLQAQQLSFSQLVEAVRREQAEHYLADPRLDLTDLAFLLGFSEQSAFQRAFKRWTGTAPGQYRRQTLPPNTRP